MDECDDDFNENRDAGPAKEETSPTARNKYIMVKSNEVADTDDTSGDDRRHRLRLFFVGIDSVVGR